MTLTTGCGRVSGAKAMLGAAAAFALQSAAPLLAQDRLGPAQEKGGRLAQTLCSGCHVIGDGAGTAVPGPVPVGVPTFRHIANQPGQTGEKIKDVLIKPHTPMPDIQLSNDEILSLIAYFESLRTNRDVPPLIVPSGNKPTFPKPS